MLVIRVVGGTISDVCFHSRVVLLFYSFTFGPLLSKGSHNEDRRVNE